MAELRDIEYWRKRCVVGESKHALAQAKLDALRIRSTEAVSKAVRVANVSKELTKASNERADEAELDNERLSRQINRIKKNLMEGQGLNSELESFILGLEDDSDAYKLIKRTLMRAVHPDKHGKADKECQNAMTEISKLINTLFEGY